MRPVYTDAVVDTLPRNHRGVLKLHYANRSGRNDIVACQVARDARHLYFHVRTREPLTSSAGPNWMWLLIDADQRQATGWEGYDYIVNRTVAGEGVTWLEKHTAGWGWGNPTEIRYRVEGTSLHLAIPRAALGLSGAGTAAAFDFKWIDHAQQPGDLFDFYVSGDAAPESRFNYRYAGD